MKPKLWKVIYALPLIGCTLYAGGYVTQFIRNYQEWSQQGNFAGNGTNPQFPSAHPAACLEALRALKLCVIFRITSMVSLSVCLPLAY